MRRVTDRPLDLYIEAPDDLGGFVRSYDVPEIVRTAAPVHLKFGLRNAPDLYPVGAHLTDVAVITARERVRRAALCLALMRRRGVRLESSPAGARSAPAGLRRFGGRDTRG